jgi:hypothetical protein
MQSSEIVGRSSGGADGVDLFFFYAMVGYIMARYLKFAILNDAIACAMAARRLVHPGTLVFLGLAR